MTMWDSLESGEIVAAVTWDGLVPYMRKFDIPVRFMNPVEGVMTWACGRVLLKDAPKEAMAYELIDSMLGPRAGEFLINDCGVPHSNRISFERVGAARIAELDLPSDPETLFANNHFWDDYEDHNETTLLFEEIRAGF
jgi:spermidine/putrescine transport system substrate-binding protein